MKCKAAPAVTTIRQNEPYCHSCLEAGVLQKVRVATKYKGLLSTGDTALLGLSGGAASAGLLYCMCCMQAADSQRPGRGKIAFQLSVLHVDCSLPPATHLKTGSGTAETNGQELQQGLQAHQDQLQSQLAVLAAAAGCVQQQPLLLHLSDVFCTDQQLQELLALQQPDKQPGEQPKDAAATPEQPAQTHHSDSKQVQQQQQQQEERLRRLQALSSAVADPTGREDLLLSLHDQLLQRAAAALGCNRLLRGDSASRVAVRVIAEAAKGRGFSLPSDIQYFDGRHAAQGGPCLLQPLREVTHKELRELCSYKGLPLLQLDGSSTAGAAAGSSSGSNNVNALSERFVHEMEASLPASIYAIIRTAAHLEPFDFTEAAALLPQAAEAAKKHHRRQQHGSEAENGAQQGTLQQWRWCGVCQAPLPAAQLATAAEAGEGCLSGASNQLGSSSSNSSSYLCYSCNRQILQQVKAEPQVAKGADPGQRAVVSLQDKMQRLRELLPPGMILESDSEGDGDEAH